MDYTVLFYLLPLGVLGLYAVADWARVRSAGGYRAIEAQKWGLLPGEAVVRSHYVGKAMGPAWARTLLHIVRTTRNRLLIARERDDAPPEPPSRTGRPSEPPMAPVLAFSPENRRPILLVAEQAAAANPWVASTPPPSAPDAAGDETPLVPALLVIPNGERFTFFCEPSGLHELHAWCAGEL